MAPSAFSPCCGAVVEPHLSGPFCGWATAVRGVGCVPALGRWSSHIWPVGIVAWSPLGTVSARGACASCWPTRTTMGSQSRPSVLREVLHVVPVVALGALVVADADVGEVAKNVRAVSG